MRITVRLRSFWLWSLTAIFGAIVFASTAHATTDAAAPAVCRLTEPQPAERMIPANLPGFRVFYSDVVPMPAELTVSFTHDGVEAPIRVDVDETAYTIVPLEPLVVGEVYVLEVSSTCSDGRMVSAEYEVIDALPLPTSLGTLTVGPLYKARAYGLVRYFSPAELQVTPEALAWQAFAEMWGTDNGAERYLRGPIMDEQFDFDHSDCEVNPMRVDGEHRYRMHAATFGSPVFATSNEVVQDIVCADAIWVDWDTRRPLTPEEIEMAERSSTDAGMPDAGTPDAGRRSTPDGGSDASPPIDDASSGGCDCSTRGPHSSDPAPIAAAIAFAIGWAIRRRRRRDQP